MTVLRKCTVLEQNANIIAGVQVDTAVYVGTGAGNVPTIRVGREAPVYVLEGVSTAVAVNVILDTVNASHGDKITVRWGTAAMGTSILSLVNATTGGTVVSTSSNVPAVTVVFNGVSGAWK